MINCHFLSKLDPIPTIITLHRVVVNTATKPKSIVNNQLFTYINVSTSTWKTIAFGYATPNVGQAYSKVVSVQIILCRQHYCNTFCVFFDGVVCFAEVEFDGWSQMSLAAPTDEVTQGWTIQQLQTDDVFALRFSSICEYCQLVIFFKGSVDIVIGDRDKLSKSKYLDSDEFGLWVEQIYSEMLGIK